MTDQAYLAFVLFLAVQIPLLILVAIDARRLGLKDPLVWELGVLVPAAGIPVILYYLSERKHLPRNDDAKGSKKH